MHKSAQKRIALLRLMLGEKAIQNLPLHHLNCVCETCMIKTHAYAAIQDTDDLCVDDPQP